MNSARLLKISCITVKELSARLKEELKNIGIFNYFIQPARSSLLKEKTIVFDYRSSTVLEDSRTDYFRFYIPAKYESAVITYLGNRLGLNQPGKGSIFSEEAFLYSLPEKSYDESILKNIKKEKLQILSDIMGICCIVQRGEGSRIAKAVLERGISVPIVTYGTGMGLRNKLGLLRITIARDKDMVYLTTHKQDCLDNMLFLIETARLDHPGKGFIYMSPLRKGILDTKIYKGTTRHVASMEQIINAIDELKKSAEWRRKSASFVRSKKKSKLNISSRLVNYTLICNEGESEPFIKTAMDNGAGGATLSKLLCPVKLNKEGLLKQAPAAREMSSLIINEATSQRLLFEFEKSSFFTEHIGGLIEISSVETAGAYNSPYRV